MKFLSRIFWSFFALLVIFSLFFFLSSVIIFTYFIFTCYNVTHYVLFLYIINNIRFKIFHTVFDLLFDSIKKGDQGNFCSNNIKH